MISNILAFSYFSIEPFCFTLAGFLGGSAGKESACSAGVLGSVPGLGRSSGEGDGNLIRYSCLENSMDRGAWGLQSMGSKKVRHG